MLTDWTVRQSSTLQLTLLQTNKLNFIFINFFFISPSATCLLLQQPQVAQILSQIHVLVQLAAWINNGTVRASRLEAQNPLKLQWETTMHQDKAKNTTTLYSRCQPIQTGSWNKCLKHGPNHHNKNTVYANNKALRSYSMFSVSSLHYEQNQLL